MSGPIFLKSIVKFFLTCFVLIKNKKIEQVWEKRQRKNIDYDKNVLILF